MNIEKLTTDLATGNDRQRRVASYKLSKLQDPSTVPHLIAAFKDTDHSVRRNVVVALRTIGTKEAIEFLESNRIEASVMEGVQMPAATVCPECGYVNKQPQSICKQCRKNHAEMSWDKPGDHPEREAPEIPPITSEERDQILEEVIADREKNGFSVTERTDTSVQMFKPRFTTNDILLRALLPGVLLFVVLSEIPIGNESTARMVESLGPGGLIFMALLYVGVPFLFKKDQAIKIVVDQSGNIETQDISELITSKGQSVEFRCHHCGMPNSLQVETCRECGIKLKP